MKNAEETDGAATLAAEAQQPANAITVTLDAKHADHPVSSTPKAPLVDSDQLYRVAEDVAVELKSVQAVHPFIEGVTGIFCAVVDMERRRRVKDPHIEAILSQVTDMMRTLLKLDRIHPSSSQIRLQAICVGVAHDISEFGNFCDVYSRGNNLRRFLKSDASRDKFAHFAETFAAHKSEIADALSLDSSQRINRIETKLDAILERISAGTGHSAEFEREVDKRGGVEACIADDAALDALSRIAHDSAGDTISPSDAAALRQDINTPLELQLEANRNRVRSEDLQSRAATVPDTVHSDTLENLIDGGESVQEYYEENSIAINDASKALMQLSLDALKGSVDILPVIQKVMGALDCVERVHPFIGVLAFKGVVAVEIKRRERAS